MKKLFTYSTAAIVIALAMVSCVNLKKLKEYPPVEVAIEDTYVREMKGIVDLGMKITVPEEFKNYQTGLRMYPVVQGAKGDSIHLPGLVVEGLVHDKMNRRYGKLREEVYDATGLRTYYAKRNQPTVVNYETSFPYKEWMSDADLYMDVYGDAYTKQVYLGRFNAATQIFSLKEFTKFTPVLQYYYYSEKLNRVVVTGGKTNPYAAHVIFPVNSAKFEKAALDNVTNFYKDAASKPGFKGADINMFVSDSPEGSYKLNEKLGDKRAEAIRGYLQSVGVKDQVNTKIEVEAWTELINRLEASDPSVLKNRDKMLEIARSNDDPDLKSYKLRQYWKDYHTILNTIYPDLRLADVSMTAAFRGVDGQDYVYVFDEFESNGRKVSSWGKPSFANTDYDDVHQQMLDAILDGDLKSAEAYANKIPNLVQNPVIISNKATLMLELKKYREAKALLKLVPEMPYSNYNLGQLQLMDQEYACASKSLAPFMDANSGIAYIYTGDNEKAIDVLSLSQKSASRDYMLALAYARIGDSKNMYDYLKSAVNANASLKNRAKRETDFARWRDTDQFKQIVK